ncbi:sensor histidine kinase [Paenibacillus sp. 843]|uniref:cache domain-containing sensor histidine kinase n=1 Tax=Paenibacillus sp. 843 TaxID=3341795 RepID=UPI00372A628F
MAGKTHFFNYLYRRTVAYIVCSVIVITVPLLILLSVYSRNEIMKYNNEAIGLINDQLDSFFRSVENTQNIITTDNSVVLPLTLYYAVPNYDSSAATEAFRSMSTTLKNMTMFQDGLQFCVVGQKGHLPVNSTKEDINDNFVPRDAAWYETFERNPEKSRIFYNNERGYYLSAEKAISIIKPIPDIQTRKPIAYVIMDITYPDFRDMVERIHPSIPIRIHDPSGQILFSNMDPSSQPAEADSKLFSRQVSPFTGITIESYVPQQLFIKQISAIIVVILCIMAVYLFIIFVISLISMKRFTRPIYMLMKAMKQVSRGNLEVAANYQGNIIELHDLKNSFNILVTGTKDLLKENYEMNLLKTQAELDALQQKINPHFLYNALETISSQAIIDGSKTASIMCQKLGALFTYSLQPQDIVTLEQEIRHLKDYVYIAEISSFYPHIYVDMNIHPDTLDQLIPKMALQPLLENCFKHGFGRDPGHAPMIRIQSSVQDGHIRIEVSDNGKGMSSDEQFRLRESLRQVEKRTLSSPGTSIGLRHVHSRLALFYGDSYAMDFQSAPSQGMRIVLLVPIQRKEDADV